MEAIKLNLVPSDLTKPICHASQFDDGREIMLMLYDGQMPYVLSDEEIELDVKKLDGNIVTTDLTVEEGTNYVIMVTTEQMCAIAGRNNCELKVQKDGKTIHSKNFYLAVEESATAGGIESASQINNLETQIAGMVEDAVENQYDSENVIFDSEPTEGHGTGYTVTSEGIKQAIDNAGGNVIDDTTPASDKTYSSNKINAVVSALIDDTETSASKTYSSNKIDGLLDEKENVIADKYLTKTPVQTYSDYRMSYRSETPDVVFIASASGYNTKAYQVFKNQTYSIRAFGYDVDSFYIGAIGEGLVSGGQTTPFKQVILCGGSAYPADFKNHDITFTAEYDGYLYINEKTSTGVSSYAQGTEKIVVRSENALIVNNGNYKHLTYIGNGYYLNREFTRRGPNNLFQLVRVGIGYLTKSNLFVETKTYMSTTTDIIGPFSIGKSGWGSNAWTGGNHSVTVNDVACPTAEQLSLSITVNNVAVSDNGIYFGDVKIIAKNKLYFAQTITGNTFEGATPAILETRIYSLTNTMNVEVYIELLDDVRIGKYYGMQYVNNNVVDVVVPDDETVITLANLSSDYSMTHKQPDIILQYANGEELHMILHRSGLGSYAHNNGNDNYGVIATYGKTYHTLISGETISTGAKLYWSGEYKMIV